MPTDHPTRIDADGGLWQYRDDRWHYPGASPRTTEDLEADCGPTREVVLVPVDEHERLTAPLPADVQQVVDELFRATGAYRFPQVDAAVRLIERQARQLTGAEADLVAIAVRLGLDTDEATFPSILGAITGLERERDGQRQLADMLRGVIRLHREEIAAVGPVVEAAKAWYRDIEITQTPAEAELGLALIRSDALAADGTERPYIAYIACERPIGDDIDTTGECALQIGHHGQCSPTPATAVRTDEERRDHRAALPAHLQLEHAAHDQAVARLRETGRG